VATTAPPSLPAPVPAKTTADLGRLVKTKYPGAYDDIADADLGSKVKAKYPGSYDDFADTTAALPPSTIPSGRKVFAAGPVGAIMSRLTGALPAMAAGVTQAFTENPLLTALAGGGAEAYRRRLEIGMGLREPEGAGATALGAGVEGAKQGLLAAPGAMFSAARPVGLGLMKAASEASPALVERFPGMFERAAAEGLPMSAEAAATGRQASAKNLGGLLEQSGQAGGVVTHEGIAGPAFKTAEKTLGRPQTPEEAASTLGRTRAALSQLWESLTGSAELPESFTPVQAKLLKQAAQDAQRGTLGQGAAGTRNISAAPSDMLQVAKGLQQALERLPKYGKQIGAAESKTQDYIGLSRVLKRQEAGALPGILNLKFPFKAGNVVSTLAGPRRLWGAGAAMANASQNPILGALADQGPRAADLALEQWLTQMGIPRPPQPAEPADTSFATK
jgi:hypothetical protein